MARLVQQSSQGMSEPSGSRPEIHSMLVLSTAHISSATKELFDTYIADGRSRSDVTECIPYIYAKFEYGWWIPIDEGLSWPDHCPSELKAMRAFALDKGCTWIMLDCDGETVHELEVFDW